MNPEDADKNEENAKCKFIMSKRDKNGEVGMRI